MLTIKHLHCRMIPSVLNMQDIYPHTYIKIRSNIKKLKMHYCLFKKKTVMVVGLYLHIYVVTFCYFILDFISESFEFQICLVVQLDLYACIKVKQLSK